MRERKHDERDRPATPAPAAAMPATQAGSGLREAAERLLRHGADAIERALSQGSAEFLAANRQEGGQ